MKRTAILFATLALAAAFFAGCSAISDALDDKIVGNWQQMSVNGVAPLLVTEVLFTKSNGYTGSTAGITTNSGTWTKSNATYTLNGAFFGFISTVSTITPSFTNSDNTFSYIDDGGYSEIYNRK